MDSKLSHGTNPLFFVGIGGIGMSALARYFMHCGHPVGGYDRVRTPISQSLEEMGAEISYRDDIEELPKRFQSADTLVVYTPAIPHDNAFLKYYESHGYTLHKRSEILGLITRNTQALCVAGTHGKTTTSTLLAHILYQSHIGANAFLGGVSLNYSSNLLLHESSPYVVIEADEYDRSFHSLTPYMAIITATSSDHLDIYGTDDAYKEAFRHFASLVDPEGLIVMYEDADPGEGEEIRAEILKYGHKSSSDYRYSNIKYENGELYFDWEGPSVMIRELQIGVPVEINVVNATAAIAVALRCGCTEVEIRAALKSFRGAHRRFERVLNDPRVPILLDDYAHHPEEIQASLDSIHKLYPDRRITVVFQPHLYSRTRDFQEEFGRTLSVVDDVILLDIYPAREEPIPGVTSVSLLPFISSGSKKVCTKEGLLSELQSHDFEVLVMMGAGDIEFEVPKVRDYLLHL